MSDRYPANYSYSAEDMEETCKCDCGQWFDLNEGYPTKKPYSNSVICPSCHQEEMKIVNKIEDLESEIDELEYLNKKPARVRKLRAQIDELKTMLEDGRHLK